MKKTLTTSLLRLAPILLCFPISIFGQGGGGPSLRFVLPERTRLLEGQLIDLVLEVRNASAVTGLKVTAGGTDITNQFSAPQAAQLDCDQGADLVIRAN